MPVRSTLNTRRHTAVPNLWHNPVLEAVLPVGVSVLAGVSVTGVSVAGVSYGYMERMG